MNKDFINSFKSSSAYNLITQNNDVVMMFIAGSRIVGATDERSDYDVVVIVKNEAYSIPQYIKDQVWSYNGKYVHFYFWKLSRFRAVWLSPYDWLMYFSNISFSLLNDDFVIYENEKHRKAIDELKANKRELGLNGVALLYRATKDLINAILQDNCINEQNYTKLISHICVASYVLRDEPIDTDLIREIKRIRWKPVSDECKSKAVERMRLLHQHFA